MIVEKFDIAFEDNFTDDFDFRDLDELLKPDHSKFAKSVVNKLDNMSKDEFTEFAEKNGIKLPSSVTHNQANTFNMSQAFEALDMINEDIDFGEKDLKSRSFKLNQNLRYNTVEEILDGKEILTHIYQALEPETLLNYYSRNGYINANDIVFFPRGTVFDFKEYIDYNGEAFFILAPTNNPNCLVAISTQDISTIFDR
jgi:hypothetical protein